MKTHIFAFTLSIIICVTARAELKWDQTSIELHPAAADKQAIGHFKYQNSGSKPVRFKSVRTSCGCTAAQSQKEEVPPGEKGEITATFNIGERTTMTAGPATLSLRTGAPLLAAAVYFAPRGGHHAVVMPPVPAQREGRLRDDVGRVTQELAYRFEELIRAAPEQWHLLQPNWPSDLATNGSGGARS